MSLSDEDVAAYVDDGGYAYALCTFKEGKPEYSLMKKRAWDRVEALQAILLDTTLTEAERSARVAQVMAG